MLVTVAEVRGHAPREAGRQDGGRPERTWGSVGGGNLEATAVARAREMIGSGAGRAARCTRPGSTSTPGTSTAASAAAARSRLLLEPLPVRPVVALFGIGHVGYELARILSRLEVRLQLVDSRAEQLDRVRLADVIDGTADVARRTTRCSASRCWSGCRAARTC